MKYFFFESKIPDMPIADHKTINIFISNLKEKMHNEGFEIAIEYQQSKDFWQIRGSYKTLNKSKKIKGPRINSESEIFFKQKYNNAVFINENEYIYAEIRLDDSTFKETLIRLFENHSWKKPMLWNRKEKPCSRPIRSLKLDISDQSIEFPEKFLSIEEKIQSLDIKNIENSLYLYDLMFIFDKPKAHLLEFKKEYKKIPSPLVEKFLKNEQMSILIYQKGIMTNKAMFFTESSVDVQIDKFEGSVNAKMLDLFLQYQRDINKPIHEYIEFRDNKLINDKETIRHKIERMKNIFEEIKLSKQANIDIVFKDFHSDFLEVYNLDIGSEIVQENPEFIGIIAKELIEEYQNYEEIFKILEYTDNIIQLGKENNLPRGSYDPFGIKKQCDFLLDWMMKNKINIDFKISEVFISQRLALKLEKINPYLLFVSKPRHEVIEYADLRISKNNLIRVINLIEKSNFTQHCKLNNEEQNLLAEINEMNLHGASQILEKINQYINSNNISPFIEKKNILEAYVNRLNMFFSISEFVLHSHL